MWWKKVVFNNYFLAAYIVSIVAIAAILIFQKFLPPILPLFYGRPSGETQLVTSLELIVAPGVSILITSINLLINIWTKDGFLKKILAITSLILSIMTAITIAKIISLVGFF